MKSSVIVRGRDVLPDNPEIGTPQRESIEQLLVQLEKKIPERLIQVRRAIRKRDRSRLEFELVKLTSRLPPLGSNSALLPKLPRDREPSAAEWNNAREGVKQLERVLSQLTQDLRSVLSGLS